MGEKNNKKIEFKEWMNSQIKGNGESYTPNTIESYCSALNSKPKKLKGIEDKYKESIFSYEDVVEFEKLIPILKSAVNFEEVNESTNKAFSNAIVKYKEFLSDINLGHDGKWYPDESVYNPNITKEQRKELILDKEPSGLVDKFTTLLKSTRNLILTGAPGTGKTYLAKQIAAAMGCTENEIGFVQFHPSYDYADFVEGLRPVSKDNCDNIGFERKDGVFKEFCKKALVSNTLKRTDLFDGINDNPVVWKISLEGTGDNPTRTDCLENGYVRIGWEKYGDVDDFNDYDDYYDGGKSILRNFQSGMKIGDIVVSCYSATETDAIGIVVGDYEYRAEGGAYPRYRKVKWIVKNIRENIVEANGGKSFTLSTVYKTSISLQDVKDIVFRNSKNNSANVEVAKNEVTKPFVFIIDEINRGEISKIFGELFFSIDPGYRGEKGRVKTQYQNLVEEGDMFSDGFFVPENVYIIGTMNDIDRSVESMDFAFRRRFAFAEVKAEDNVKMLDELEALDLKDDAINRMNRLNSAISKIEGLSSAYHIGASYFLKLKEYGDDCRKALWNYHLEGLLREYLRGMPNADEEMRKLENAYWENESNTNNG